MNLLLHPLLHPIVFYNNCDANLQLSEYEVANAEEENTEQAFIL